MSLDDKLEYTQENSSNILILNNNRSLLADRRLALYSSDAAAFNRICGPLIAATADPADRAFSTQVAISAEMVSVSATFSRQIRHISAPRNVRDPSLILLFARDGNPRLRVGSSSEPLDVALVRSDVDFAVRPDKAEGACTVGCVVLENMPDLVARLPPAPVMPRSTADAPGGGPEELRDLGNRIVAWIAAPPPHAPGEASRYACQMTRLIRDHFASDAWTELATPPGRPTRSSVDGGRDLVAAVERYLRDHSGEAELTPARLARHCAVSVRKLYNAFAAADISLRATVLSYRLEEARRRLHERTVKKVTSVAYDTGFRDVSTFYRNFRREFGFSPRHNGEAPGGRKAAAGVRDGGEDREEARWQREAAAKRASIGHGQGSPPAGSPSPRDTLFRDHPRGTARPCSLPEKYRRR